MNLKARKVTLVAHCGDVICDKSSFVNFLMSCNFGLELNGLRCQFIVQTCRSWKSRCTFSVVMRSLIGRFSRSFVTKSAGPDIFV